MQNIYIKKDKFYNNKDFIEKNYIVPDINLQKYKKDKRGGSNKLHIILTSQCFKSLCLLLNTNKGKQIKQYYITTEYLIKLYEKYQREFYIIKEK